VDVFLIWHVRHASNIDGSPIEHRDGDGEVVFDEAHDDMKVIGIYSTELRAMEALERAGRRPGFCDEPDCFVVVPYTLDEDEWTDGFVTLHDNN
jgi:hypothetical protein